MLRSGELLRISNPDAVMVFLGPSVTPVYPQDGYTLSDWAFPIGSETTVTSNCQFGLFDDVKYTVQVSTHEPIAVSQNYQPIDLTWVRYGSQYIATTRIRFRQVGWSEFRLGESGVRIKILSRKMDYDTDYRMMVQDMETQVRGLIAKLLSASVNEMNIIDNYVDSWSYWISLLENIWGNLERDVKTAWRMLPLSVSSEEHQTHLDRMRRLQARDVRSYARLGGPRIITKSKMWTFLIPERRYILELLEYIRRKLERIFDRVPELRQNARLISIVHDVTVLLHQLAKEVGLERVTDGPQIPTSPLAQTHSALRRVIRWHRQLQMGLFPNNDRFLVGIKDLNLLYEYWCYLTIIRIVVEESGGLLQVNPVVSSNPLDIVLASGIRNAAHVRLPNGEIIKILYERQFVDLPTVAQKPDYVIQLRGLRKLIIFDAKYRFELNDDYLKYYGQGNPIPPIDTINGMHQYHDAIVTRNIPYDRVVDRAIVLFPLPHPFISQWKDHRFYKSIESVGVGSLPLLPRGGDNYLREEIRRYLSSKS